MEYLDERFPHPPLMPVYQVTRGRSRLMMHRIELDWYSLAQDIIDGPADKAEKARQELKANLLSVAPILNEAPPNWNLCNQTSLLRYMNLLSS